MRRRWMSCALHECCTCGAATKKMRRTLPYSLLLAPLLIAFSARASFGASVEQVEKAIRAGVDHLYAVQAGDNWDNGWNQDNSNTGGRTALVVYSLLAA